jgi:hypothetical protein
MCTYHICTILADDERCLQIQLNGSKNLRSALILPTRHSKFSRSDSNRAASGGPIHPSRARPGQAPLISGWAFFLVSSISTCLIATIPSTGTNTASRTTVLCENRTAHHSDHTQRRSLAAETGAAPAPPLNTNGLRACSVWLSFCVDTFVVPIIVAVVNNNSVCAR